MKLGCAPNKLVLRKIDLGNEKFKKTKGGIIVNNDKAVLEITGEVVAVGRDLQSWVKVGDTVYHGMHAGTVFTCSALAEPGDVEPDEALLSIADYEVLALLPKETEE